VKTSTLEQPISLLMRLANTIALYRVILIMVVVTTLAIVNLPYSPRIWYDEGSHLHVPKTLVQDGVYADKSAEGYRFHGPTVGVGPTIMLPIAGVFELFGIGLVQGRAVIVIYMLIAFGTFYLLTRKYQGRTVAVLALLFLLASRTFTYEGMIEYGRQVLGEVPGLAFLLLGLFAWLSALERLQQNRKLQANSKSSFWLSFLAGLGIGLALLTKNQFVLIVPLAMAIVTLLDLVYYRVTDWYLRIVPLLVACLCFGILTFLQYQFLGAGTFMKTIEETRKAAGGAIFVFDIRATLRAGYYLLRPDLYGGLLIVSVGYTLWRARQRTAQGLAEALFGIMTSLWLIWFVGASLGWPRYAFPAVALGAISVARLVVDIWNWLNVRQGWLQFSFAAYILLALAIPISLTTRSVLQPDDSAQRFAAYINTHVPEQALVATWEQELGFLTDHRYQYPPQSLLAEAVRRQWFGGEAIQYDWLSMQPEYVALGPFGEYTQVYDSATLDQSYVRIEQIGHYQLYERRSN
jgi:4-amino-4-deoxy-L-arabinose transferase-like glycosyltransferase